MFSRKHERKMAKGNHRDRHSSLRSIQRLSKLRVILSLGILALLPYAAYADLDILVVGSTHSYSEGGESGVLHEKAFSPTTIATELQSILDNDSAISETVNVVFDDVYKNESRYVQTSKTGFTTWDFRCYSLAQHYMWPTGKTNRLDNLRGENGTAWDYVVIMEDPYVMANFPGMFVEGADMIVDEVRSGTAEPILFAQWPENSSSFATIAGFNEVVNRVGDSSGVRVIPGGKGWLTLSPQDSSTSHPTPDGAYLAAASIYSEIFDRNAKTSSYTYDDAIADHALSNIQTHAGVAQFSGAFTNLTVFSMKHVSKRLVSFRHTGTSTESYLNDALMRLDARCGVTFTRTATHDPTDWDFNYGRGNDWWEDSKDYSVNPSIYDRAYGFAMHYYGMTNSIRHMAYGIDKQFYGSSYNDGTDLGIAYNMIRPGTREASLPADVRAIPIRLLWTKMDEQFPGMNPLNDNTHMNFKLNDASAAFMYTLLSGRCPLVDEPGTWGSSAWQEWLGHKIGYETAWRMSQVTTRVPGFQVMPASTDDTVTPSAPTTLSVKFWYAPTSDVTVVVSTDDLLVGKATPSTLTFTPSNYTNAQTVTVSAQTGSAGTHEFNVTLATSSTDPIFDNLSDSWEFHNTRPEGPLPSDIRVLANDQLIWSGDMDPNISDSSHYGVLTGPGSRTFTITNISDLTTVTLTNSPKVTLTDLSGCFSLTQDASLGTLSPGGAATTFDISCAPPSPGLHTALVSVASTDWAVPDYQFRIAAIFADASPAADTQPTVSSSPTAATLGGVLTDGGGAEAWICWGDNDGGTSTMGAWDHVIYMGTEYEAHAFSANISGLLYGVQYEQRVFVSNYAGTAWSSLEAFTSAAPSPAASIIDRGVDLITTTTADLHGQLDATNSVFTVSLHWSENDHANAAAWLADGAASSIGLGTFTNVLDFDLQHRATGLSVGTTYYYTFRINNEATELWSDPNGSFTAASAPTVDNASGASTGFQDTAMLRAVLSGGSGAEAWICWGDSDAGTGSTSDWDNVVSIGPVLQGAVFTHLATGLADNGTYWYRSYVANAAGTDWSDTPETFAGTAVDLDRSQSVIMGWGYTSWTGDEDSGIDSKYTYTATQCFGNNHAGVTVNGVYFPEAWLAADTNWAIGTLGNQWNGDYTAAITGGSEDLAEEMLYNVNPRTITFTGLSSGTVYEASLFSVGWENGTRDLPCSADGGPSTNINQDAYGNEGGIRITYTYEASSSSQMVSVASSGFHLYALANREVPPMRPVVNIAPTSVSNNQATVGAVLNAESAEYDVYVYWGTADGGTNALSWISGAYVGSWTNEITNLSYLANSLVAGQPHYYTFVASNASETVWASPSWTFTTPGTASTINHSVPHTWLATQDGSWTIDYEAAVMADQDGDGFLTWEEYWSGTDPMNSNSHLRVDAIQFNGGNVVLHWQHAQVGAGISDILIEASTNLTVGPWTIVGTNSPVDGTNVWVDVSSSHRYFRLIAPGRP